LRNCGRAVSFSYGTTSTGFQIPFRAAFEPQIRKQAQQQQKEERREKEEEEDFAS